MIPKIIHYCWFGGAEMRAEYCGYIDEWRDLHPEWEIKLWDEHSFHDDSLYYISALKQQNWANVSNYVRLKILLQHGGIYLDTDIKILKPFDNLLVNDCFLGFENESSANTEFWVNNAVIGARAQHPFINRCLVSLTSNFDGSEQANESSPQLVTKVLIEDYGLKVYGEQKLKDVTLYPKEYFYPIPWFLAKNTKQYGNYISEETYAVHMWGRSWFSKDMMLNMIDELQVWSNDQSKYISDLKNGLEYEKTRADSFEKSNKEMLAEINNLSQKLALNEVSSKSEIDFNNSQYLETLIEEGKKSKEEFSILQSKIEGLETKIEAVTAINSLLSHMQKDFVSYNHSILQRFDEHKFLVGNIIHNLNDAYSMQRVENEKLRMRLSELQQELEVSSRTLEEKNVYLDQQQGSISWYQSTYENRSLLGVLKEKILRK